MKYVIFVKFIIYLIVKFFIINYINGVKVANVTNKDE